MLIKKPIDSACFCRKKFPNRVNVQRVVPSRLHTYLLIKYLTTRERADCGRAILNPSHRSVTRKQHPKSEKALEKIFASISNIAFQRMRRERQGVLDGLFFCYEIRTRAPDPEHSRKPA